MDKCVHCGSTKGLLRVPFLYLDRNDKQTPDYDASMKDYKQYYECEPCSKEKGTRN